VAAGRRALASVRERFGGVSEPAQAVRETYLDSFDWLVQRAGGALSAIDGPSGVLLAWRGPGDRLRHRLLVPTLPAFVAELPGSPMRDELTRVVGVRRMLPVARLELRRAALRVEDDRGKTVARLILEHGTVEGAEGESRRRKLPATVQLIPLRGYAEIASRVAKFLEADLRMRPAEPARLTRALAVAGRAVGDKGSKLRPRLDPAERSDRAMKRVLRALFDTLRLNEDGVRNDVDSEFLHDFRVSVRRTRSALAQIKSVFPAPAVDRFRGEFGWLGKTTNLLRDLDVHLLGMPDCRAMLPEAERGALDPFEELLARRRSVELERLVVDLDSERYAALVREWDRFLEQLPDAAAGETPKNAERPILDVASERVRRAHRKVLAHGRAIDDESPAEALHALRIDCKKLRYLLEFFASIFAAGDVAVLVKALKQLQDNLGRHNDLDVQAKTVRQDAQELAAEGMLEGATVQALIDLLAALESARRDERGRFAECFGRFDTRKNAGRLARAVRGTNGRKS
jgi:CHAD domain-containing protein